VVPPPPTTRTPGERLAALVDEFRALRQTARDNFRRRCAILRQIRDEGLWEGGAEATFDAWALRVLHLNRSVVTRMLGIAYGPIGGTGRRPGPKPGQQRAASPPAGGAVRGRARGGQEDEVEGIHERAIVSTSADLSVGLASGRVFVSWLARQLEQWDRYGVESRLAGLSTAELTEATGLFARASAFFGRCATAAADRKEVLVDD
jgi:hypothetical protein